MDFHISTELDKEMLVSQHQLSNLETGCAISREEMEKVSWCIIGWIGTSMSEARALI